VTEVAIKALVHGRVQGVSYRAFVRQQALQHQLQGSASNLGNGSVEVYLSGHSRDIDSLIHLLKQGPKHANVERVEWQYIDTMEFSGFSIG